MSSKPPQPHGVGLWALAFLVSAHFMQLLMDFIDGKGVLQLPSTPLPRLQHLYLQAAHVLPPGSSGLADSSSNNSTAVGNSSRRAATLLPKLANFAISNCSMEHPSHLAQIIRAPEVTHLSISELTFADGSRVYDRDLRVRQEISAAVSDVLQQLPRLSILHLPHLDLNAYALQQIAAMSDLQDLNIILTPSLPACARGLSKLPSSITKLQLRDQRDGVKYGADPSLPPRLQQLSLLLHLELDLCVFQPTVLADLTSLQRLHLKDCQFRECFTETGEHLSGVAALLRAMQQLQLLQEFQLSANCILGLLSGHAAPQLFAALPASSNLERLQLTATDQQPLPLGAMRRMFPQGRTFLQLRDVSIVMLVEPDNPFAADDAQQWCMDSTDLASFISCCPGLQDLDITGAIKPGADVSALLQLPTSCTSLNIGGAAFTDTAAPVLAQLTHLKYMSWCNSDLTDTGLEQLTALTSLTRLLGYGNLEISDELFGAGGLQDADTAADPDPEQAQWALDNKAFEIWWSVGEVCCVAAGLVHGLCG